MRLTREQIIKGGYGVTKTGGYKEIPSELIEEAAEKVGLEEGEIPEVVIKRGRVYPLLRKIPSGELVVEIPRRQSKWRVPGSLAHEFAHIKQELVEECPTYRDQPLELRVSRDLETKKIEKGYLTVDDLIDTAVHYHIVEGFPRRLAVSFTMQAGSKLGISRGNITRAKKWLKDFWLEGCR